MFGQRVDEIICGAAIGDTCQFKMKDVSGLKNIWKFDHTD